MGTTAHLNEFIGVGKVLLSIMLLRKALAAWKTACWRLAVHAALSSGSAKFYLLVEQMSITGNGDESGRHSERRTGAERENR